MRIKLPGLANISLLGNNNVLSIAVMTVYIVLVYRTVKAVTPSDYPKKI